jgi:hypothetical protein
MSVEVFCRLCCCVIPLQSFAGSNVTAEECYFAFEDATLDSDGGTPAKRAEILRRSAPQRRSGLVSSRDAGEAAHEKRTKNILRQL